jgi:hypothetical protein
MNIPNFIVVEKTHLGAVKDNGILSVADMALGIVQIMHYIIIKDKDEFYYLKNGFTGESFKKYNINDLPNHINDIMIRSNKIPKL